MDFFAAWSQSILTLGCKREARGESVRAQTAMICSVLQRVERASWWGYDVPSVMEKVWQYSSLTDPHDPQLAKVWLDPHDKRDQKIWDLVGLGLAGSLVHPFPGGDSYHDISIPADKLPKWTKTARRCGSDGRLVFYDVDHDYEGPLTGHVVP